MQDRLASVATGSDAFGNRLAEPHMEVDIDGTQPLEDDFPLQAGAVLQHDSA